jgi:hypothetical protein
MPVVDFGSTNQPPVNPRSEEKILSKRFFDEWRSVRDNTPSAPLRDAAYAYCHHLEARIRQLERTVRNYLKAVPTDALRASLMAELYGTQVATKRDPNLLTPIERRLVNHYNQMDNAARQMVRTLFERLADTSIDGEDADLTDHDEEADDGGAR